MLTKLMKHEFRATGRTMLPLYLILLATAVGANFSTRGLANAESGILSMLGVLLVTAFGVAICAVCTMAMVVMVYRFYKNLLQDEGYLMMTLPVSIHQHIWSKLIVSAVWFAATALMVIVASCVMAFRVDFLGSLWEGFTALFENVTAYYALNGTALVLELLALCFLGCCAMCLQFYAALAAGHTRPSHKLAWSVGIFFLFQFAMQFFGGLLMILADALGIDVWFANWTFRMMEVGQVNGMVVMHLVMLALVFIAALYGAIYYFVTTYCLKKHLNLE